MFLRLMWMVLWENLKFAVREKFRALRVGS